MVTYPNQKMITINKEEIKKGSGVARAYLIAYCDLIETAAQKLNGNEFKLYIYLLSNQNGYSLAFSPKDISAKYGCSQDTARNAFAGLLSKGFLVEDKKHKFVFCDKPIKQLDLEVQKKLETKPFYINGEAIELTYDELLDLYNGDADAARKAWEE